MLKKIVCSLFGGFAILALALYIFAGARYPLALSEGFRNVLKASQDLFKQVKFEIPPIPSIPVSPVISNPLDFLAAVGNFFIGVFNLVISAANAFVTFVTFIVCLLKTWLSLSQFDFRPLLFA